MLSEWDKERRKRGPKSKVNKKGWILYDAVEILPRRRMSLAEKYAVLAAVHDQICERARRIDLWSTRKSLRQTGVAKAKAGVPYAVLCDRVAELGDRHRKRIEQVLDDVQHDLAEIPEAPSPPKALPLYLKPLTCPRHGPVPDLDAPGAITGFGPGSTKSRGNAPGNCWPVMEPRGDFIRNARTVLALHEDRRQLLDMRLQKAMDRAQEHAAALLAQLPAYEEQRDKGPELYVVAVVRATASVLLPELMAAAFDELKKCLEMEGTCPDRDLEQQLWGFGHSAQNFGSAWLGQCLFYIVGPRLVNLGIAANRVRELVNESVPRWAGNACRDHFMGPLHEWRLSRPPVQRQADAQGAHTTGAGSEGGLHIARDALQARWGDTRLAINSHADFKVLQSLHEAEGMLVSYIELLRAVKPAEITEAVEKVREAPPEVKNAVSHIRAAFKTARCPWKVESVRWKGYRLCRPDE